MKQNIFNEKIANNYANLMTTAKAAANEIKTAKSSIFYFIRLFNKLARKNEFVEGTNLLELGKKARNWAILHGYELKKDELFTAYLFTNVNGVSCYKKTLHKKASSAFCTDIDIIIWQDVKLTDNGVISAIKYVLGVDAKAADKTAKAAAKAARKAQNDAKAAARKALKKQQHDAIKDFQAGKMPLSVFEEIMRKVA